MRKSILRRSVQTPDIPTASTADVAFLLILFFMVTTVFRATALNLSIRLPEAKSTQRILIRHLTAYIWADAEGRIYIDDNLVPLDMVNLKMGQKIWEKPDLLTVLNIDQNLNYGTLDRLLDQLKQARAYRITFATRFKGER
jgi:biopolymer transport protein ExbD